MSRILLGVSGGVAAYKALELVRLASGAGHSLRVVQTPASRRFVGPASFAALTGAPVLASEFERDPARGAFPGQPLPDHDPLSHLELASNADLFVIAPATANTIAKLAHGLADNLLSSCALAVTCPLVLAPAMNNHMYEHPATQANLRALAERGALVVAPDTGRLASHGEEGVGRLADPARILAVCEELLAGTRAGGPADGTAPVPGTARVSNPARVSSSRVLADGAARSWSGLRVLVTAGGTREPIDSVRFLGNSSSGRMGLALASAALARGARVTVIAANVALRPPSGAAWREVATAAELQRACEREFPDCDVLLMAAAVADFRPRVAQDGKIKKAGHARLELELEPTADVLAALAAQRRAGQTLVGFAAEHGRDGLADAERKLRDKQLDILVVNDISRTDIGFEAEHNEVAILTGRGRRDVPRAAKRIIAEAILEEVAQLRGTRSQTGG
jgi:phosphopantothenoylcysteine decarboxylase/phosphopantothenate--cysteine ligase